MSIIREWVKILILTLTALTACNELASATQKAGGLAVPAILVERSDIGVKLIARIVAIDSGLYSGQLTVSSKGPAGSTLSSQKGAINIEAGSNGDIATLGLSLRAGQVLNAEFIVSNEHGKVAAATLSITGSD